MGWQVGARIVDLLFVRERAARRETKLLNVLLMVKSTVWKALFSKEADKLERANDDDKTYYIIEKEPLVNRFISVPKAGEIVKLNLQHFSSFYQTLKLGFSKFNLTIFGSRRTRAA